MKYCINLRRLGLRLAGCALACIALCAPFSAFSDSLNADDALLAVRDAAARGDIERAASILPAVGNHPLAAYAEYWLLQARLTRDELPPPTSRELLDFVQRHTGSYVVERLRQDWLRYAGRQGDWAHFDPQYAIWAFKDDAEIECYAWLSRYEKMPTKGQEKGQPKGSDKGQDRSLLASAPAVFLAGQGTEGCFAVSDRLQARGDWKRADVIAMTRRLLEEGAFESSRRLAESFLSGAALKRLDLALRDPMRYLARDTATGGDGREIAMLALLRAIRNDPEVACGLLSVATGQRLTRDDRRQARVQCAVWSARKHLPEAMEWNRDVLDLPLSDAGYAWAVRAALRGGTAGVPDWRLVLASIDRMPAALKEEATWVYWRGRALQALNRQEEAVRTFESIAGQFEFYGQLAAEELGRPSTVPPLAAPVTEAELRSARTRPGIMRALKFYELNLRTEAQREWNYALRGLKDRELLAVAQVAYRAELYDRTVNTSNRTQAEHDFKQRFVMPFRSLISAKAREAGLDEAWVYGLIRQESRFILAARSGVGASGLMQVMPATARWVASKTGMPNVSARLNELEVNVSVGTHYLKLVLDDLSNSPLLASAAYNAGPRRAQRWLASLAGPMEGAIFAETIPFEETRDYAKRVLSNATYYAALMTGRPQSLKARLGRVNPDSGVATELP